MLNYAVANPAIENDPTETQTESPKALARVSLALTSARNRVTTAILEKMIPNTFEVAQDEVGCVVEYDGANTMIEGEQFTKITPGRMGLEVRDGDLIFVTSNGVWIGTSFYSEMPKEIETYNFLTSGVRSDYIALLEDKLDADLQKHIDVMDFLMAA